MLSRPFIQHYFFIFLLVCSNGILSRAQNINQKTLLAKDPAQKEWIISIHYTKVNQGAALAIFPPAVKSVDSPSEVKLFLEQSKGQWLKKGGYVVQIESKGKSDVTQPTLASWKAILNTLSNEPMFAQSRLILIAPYREYHILNCEWLTALREWGGLVLLDPIGVSQEQNYLWQQVEKWRQLGLSKESIVHYVDFWQTVMEISRRESKDSDWKEQIYHLHDNHMVWMKAEDAKAMGMDKKQLVRETAEGFRRQSWQDQAKSDPLECYSLIERPTLLGMGIAMSPELVAKNRDPLENMIFLLDKTNFSIIELNATDINAMEKLAANVAYWLSQIKPRSQ